ncbi:hypothetical protein Q5X58_15760 [Acinetobacter baumannii]|nr:hypothetical protein [Acinetobacter baumannii]
MTEIIGQPRWSSVRLLGEDEYASGGENGNMNEQAKSFADRTEFIKEYYATKEEVAAIENGSFSFATYQLALDHLSTLPVNCSVSVTADPNTALNTTYTYDGSQLIPSSNDKYLNLEKNFNNRESISKDRNLFTYDEITGADFSRIVPTLNKSSLVQYNNMIKMTCKPSTTLFTEFRYRFSAAHFKKLRISASAKIVSATAGTGNVATATRFFVAQTTLTGGTLSREQFIIGDESAITSERTVKIENLALNPAAIFVEIGFEFIGKVSRELVVTDLFLSDTLKADFIRPTLNPINLFQDYYFAAKYATTWQASSVSFEESVPVLNLVSPSTLQVLYKFPAQGAFSPGAIVQVKSDIWADVYGPSILLLFYNEIGTEIGRIEKNSVVSNAYEKVSLEQVIPAGTVYWGVRLTKYEATYEARFKNVFISSNRNPLELANFYPLNIINVNSMSGNDKNIGTWNSPLKTLAAAMAISTPNTKWVLQAGDYTDCPEIKSSILSLEVVAARNSQVRIIGGSKLTGFTKVDGFNKVWSAPLAIDPAPTEVTGMWLYQHGVPEAKTFINSDERFKYHEGRTHRLKDFTRIWRVKSIDAIETATRPSWYWENGKVYLSCVGYGDPNLADIRVPDNQKSPFYTNNTTKDQALKLVGIECWYWLHGFRTWDFSYVEYDRCKAFGNKSNGFEHSNSMFVKRTACEAAGNWTDGTGGHVHVTQGRPNPSGQSCRYLGIDNHEHDNGDDGQSLHEMWHGADFGGLVEFNGDRGVATAVGAHTRHVGMIAFKNGQGKDSYQIDDGAGFACVGTVAENEMGIDTNMELISCISEGNLVNYNVAGSPTNTLLAIDSKSIDPVEVHFASGARMTLMDTRFRGDKLLKKIDGAGTINIKNTQLVE